ASQQRRHLVGILCQSLSRPAAREPARTNEMEQLLGQGELSQTELIIDPDVVRTNSYLNRAIKKAIGDIVRPEWSVGSGQQQAEPDQKERPAMGDMPVQYVRQPFQADGSLCGDLGQPSADYSPLYRSPTCNRGSEKNSPSLARRATVGHHVLGIR